MRLVIRLLSCMVLFESFSPGTTITSGYITTDNGVYTLYSRGWGRGLRLDIASDDGAFRIFGGSADTTYVPPGSVDSGAAFFMNEADLSRVSYPGLGALHFQREGVVYDVRWQVGDRSMVLNLLTDPILLPPPPSGPPAMCGIPCDVWTVQTLAPVPFQMNGHLTPTISVDGLLENVTIDVDGVGEATMILVYGLLPVGGQGYWVGASRFDFVPEPSTAAYGFAGFVLIALASTKAQKTKL